MELLKGKDSLFSFKACYIYAGIPLMIILNQNKLDKLDAFKVFDASSNLKIFYMKIQNLRFLKNSHRLFISVISYNVGFNGGHARTQFLS